MLNRLWFALTTYPSAWIKWLVNHSLFQAILNHRFFKRFFTINTINLLCLAGVVFLVVYDFKLVNDPPSGDTWSEMMRSYGRRYLVLPWLCGVLIGHLFHLRDDLRPWGGRLNPTQAYNLIFWFTAFWVLQGSAAYITQWYFSEWVLPLIALLGCAVGYFVWPIHRESKKWTWFTNS